jgi:hypothetical protein
MKVSSRRLWKSIPAAIVMLACVVAPAWAQDATGQPSIHYLNVGAR